MRTIKRNRKLQSFASLAVLILSLTAMWGVPAVAQSTTAQLSGTVTDNAGSAVAGAAITVEQIAIGFKQTGKTGPGGEYLFPSLPVGRYELTIEMPGFNTYVQNGIVLTVGLAASQNITLHVGAVTQQVTVVANPSMVTTQSASIGQLVNQKSMVGLPLNGREAQQLVFLIPGAVNVSSQYCGFNCEGGVLPGEQYAKINGGGSNGVYYLLDGVDYNDSYVNANLPFPNPDALQEFNVETNNMSAIYGNATGGVVNVVSKSGTDQIHGDAFEFLRNYAMDARNYFATSPNPLKQNQFGATIGGPILKDKLFYFGSYQGTRTSTSENGLIQFVPTGAERQGDFSDLLPGTQLEDPATGLPFPDNQLPSISPVAQYLLQHIPLPNGPGRQLTFNGTPAVQNTNEFLIKADYSLGKHHLSGHFFQTDFGIPIVLPPTSNILATNTDQATSITLKHISVIDTYVISTHSLLDSYFGYTRQNGTSLSSSPFSIADAGSQIAQTPSLGNGQSPALMVNVSGGITTGSTLQYGAFNRGSQSLRETATLIRGPHELQFGGEAFRIQAPMGLYQWNDGVFDFSNSLSGDNTADFMLGDVSTFQQAGGLYLDFTGINWSTFVQDDWRASHRFTVSAGLRWDPFIPYKDSEGRVACFVPGAQSTRYPNAPAGLIFGGDNHDTGCPPSSIFNNLGNFGPRIGFALRLTADGKSSLRGGGGYYYQTPNTVAFEDVVGVPPFAPIINLTDVNFTDPYGSAGVANPFPAEFGPRNPGASATFPSNISFEQIFSRHYRLPQILTWNLTLERGIGPNWLIRAAYMGSKGSYLSGTGDQESGMRQMNPAIYIPGQSTEANTQQRRIYPSFGFVNSINSGVDSSYNALQLSLEKHLTQGFSFLANFTWSRSLNDFGPNGEPGGLYTNTCTCGRSFDYGPDGGDLNKILKVSGNYSLPRIPFKGVANKIVNGWEASGIATWQTGFPFTIFSQSDNSFSAIGADRADLTVPHVQDAILSGGRPHSELISEWFNTAAFASNAIGTFGDSGKNILRGPRYFDTDLALLKNTDLEGPVSFQFRAEFYNATNHAQFGMPDHGLTDSSFGQITSAQSPRILQMGLKAIF